MRPCIYHSTDNRPAILSVFCSVLGCSVRLRSIVTSVELYYSYCMASYIYSKLSSLFQSSKPVEGSGEGSFSSRVISNGVLPNGKAAHFNKKRSPVPEIPKVEITDSPTIRRLQKAASVGSISGLSSEDSSIKSPDEGRPSSAGSRGKGEERDLSMSPTQSLTTEAVLSPSRKTMEALRKVWQYSPA